MKRLLFLTIISLIALVGCSDKSDDPKVNDGDRKLPVNTKEEYGKMTVNMVIDEKGFFWISNTNSVTLGDEINLRNNNEDGDFMILEEGPNGRTIYSFDGHENNENNRWIILSPSCGEYSEEEGMGQCDDNVDSIILEDGIEIVLLYADMKELTYVEDDTSETIEK